MESCVYNKELNGHLLAGGQISAWYVIRDELLTACDNQISSYSIKTGNLLHVLDCKSSTITGIAVSPNNSHQLLTSTACGSLIQWDMTDWRLMKRLTLGDHISHLLVSTNSVYVVVRKNENNKTVSVIKEICPLTLSSTSKSLIIRKQCDNFTISKNGSHILYTRDTMLRVLCTDSFATFTRHTAENRLTSAAIHPNGHIAAVGDSKGKITVLNQWNVKGAEDSVTHHWHANSVQGLSFAPRSEALFSGAREAVLVKWLEGEPQFLPRLGFPIERVICSPKGDTVLTLLGDNTIGIINLNTWDVKSRIINVIKNNGSTSQISSISRGIIFGARSGELQVFDPVARKHLKTLDICQQNKTSGQIANKSIVHTQVTHFKIIFDWLVTVERRDDGYITPECRLKFWKIAETTGVYELCTNVDPPHTKKVTSLTLSSIQSQYTAITTSKDCTVKIWQCPIEEECPTEENYPIEDNYPIEEEDIVYNQWGMIQCLTHRNGISQCSVVSNDGTVLAVAYDYIIVLYNTKDWCVIDEIPHQVKNISQVFMSGYYLLAVSEDLISSYNLTSLTLCYEVQSSKPHVLMLDTIFIAFITRANHTDAYIFNPSCSKPIIIHRAVCPGSVVGVCCMDESIVMLTSHHSLYSLSVKPPPPLITTDSSVAQCDNVFSELLKIPHHVNDDVVITRTQCKDAINIVSAPSHALPVMSSVCKLVLSNLLPTKQ